MPRRMRRLGTTSLSSIGHAKQTAQSSRLRQNFSPNSQDLFRSDTKKCCRPIVCADKRLVSILLAFLWGISTLRGKRGVIKLKPINVRAIPLCRDRDRRPRRVRTRQAIPRARRIEPRGNLHSGIRRIGRRSRKTTSAECRAQEPAAAADGDEFRRCRGDRPAPFGTGRYQAGQDVDEH